MWIIVGANTKVRVVGGGKEADRRCGGCRETVRFRECDVKDTFTASFVELFDTTQRRMVCTECGEDHDVAEFFADRAALPASTRQPARGMTKPPAEQRRARAAPARPDDDVEEELAALKRKLAKGSPSE